MNYMFLSMYYGEFIKIHAFILYFMHKNNSPDSVIIANQKCLCYNDCKKKTSLTVAIAACISCTIVKEGYQKMDITPTPLGPATIPADEVKRVKALGFLHRKGTDRFNCRVITRNGKVTAEQLKRITEAAVKFGNGEVSMTTRLTMEIQGIPYENIDAIRTFLAEGDLETGGTGAKIRPVVCCKGTTCQYGLLDSYDLANEIHERFFKGYHSVTLPHKFKIAVGGCPNNCVKPNLNDVGIVGQRVPDFDPDKCRGCGKCRIEAVCPVNAAHVVDGKLSVDPEVCTHCGRCVGKCPFHARDNATYGYRVYIGGRWGKKIAQGLPLKKTFTSKEEVLDVVEKAILLFRDQGIRGERFSDTISRIGFDCAQAYLLDNELLERKSQILTD